MLDFDFDLRVALSGIIVILAIGIGYSASKVAHCITDVQDVQATIIQELNK